MCLSDVIALKGETEELLFQNVASVSQQGERLIFSDILGRQNEVTGRIQSIDLLENIIRIETSQDS
ncbi:MAG: CooT family nickel-binding protein [Solobacterium sp.]|jgi:predicted RNA-binding protein|nr:CooT family nickel-binding protein [Solobacterium sp.]MBR3346218.1 CooT family nickel-binding protein [Solobacterium sp.]